MVKNLFGGPYRIGNPFTLLGQVKARPQAPESFVDDIRAIMPGILKLSFKTFFHIKSVNGYKHKGCYPPFYCKKGRAYEAPWYDAQARNEKYATVTQKHR